MDVVTAGQVATRRQPVRTTDGSTRLNTWYLGAVSTVGGPGPQAFLVEMLTPQARLRPHYHSAEQFQVFVGGDGRLGNDPIEPPLAFYTDAYTSYGPITAGVDGLRFFTFRREHDSGASYMPESRGGRGPSPRRRLAVRLGDVAAQESARTSGVGIELVRIGPDEPATILSGTPVAERFALVLAGDLVVADTAAAQWSVLHDRPGGDPVEVRAAGTGATVGVFTFDPVYPRWFNVPVAQRRAGADPT